LRWVAYPPGLAAVLHRKGDAESFPSVLLTPLLPGGLAVSHRRSGTRSPSSSTPKAWCLRSRGTSTRPRTSPRRSACTPGACPPTCCRTPRTTPSRWR
jgi:hypothetical protein